jgi:hypothetical protein
MRANRYSAPVAATANAGSSAVAERHLKQPQIDAASSSQEQMAAEVKKRDLADQKWEWRVPIRFYGEAVDEDQQPVANADVHFQWTNLSAKGTTDANVKTDGQGKFSLENVEGKRLLVRVSKPGYYSSDLRNRLSYEYANPFEEGFHQPNIDKPVLFHLRKQGSPGDLIKKSAEIVLPGDGSAARIRLETGKVEANGELKVEAWKPWPPRPMSPAYDWKVALTIPTGGFIDAIEEFPFEAPQVGYEQTYIVDMPANAEASWKVSAERTLYFAFGEPKKYGRISLRTDGNSRYVFIDYVINRSGGRNLEDALPPK